MLFAAIPFLAIVLFFQLTVHYRLFAVPTQAGLEPDKIYSLMVPLIAAKRGTTLIGFYHIPIAALLMGFALLVKARRYSVMTVFALIFLFICKKIWSSRCRFLYF